MADRLKGKVALVVGAGSIGPGWGNGKATAVAFAREGARVFCADINLAAAAESAAIIKGEGGDALAHGADASKAADVAAMVEACASAYGRIDVLDNNVGIAELGGVVEVPEAAWDNVFAVNLKSAYLTMKHVIATGWRGKGARSSTLVGRVDPLHRRAPRPLCDQAALGNLIRPRRSNTWRSAPGERDPPRLMKTPWSRRALGSAKLRRRRCRGDGRAIARYRWDSAGVPGTSPGRRCISPATRAATSPASNSWSTAASRSNTPEARLYRQPCFCIVKP
jgi:NAD(P)-dependent dehydrogenase (short-subunit alcohol dehydrogenase family)